MEDVKWIYTYIKHCFSIPCYSDFDIPINTIELLGKWKVVKKKNGTYRNIEAYSTPYKIHIIEKHLVHFKHFQQNI